MAATFVDPFSARATFETGSGPATLYRLRALDDAGITNTSRLPYSLRMVLEALLRTCDDYEVTEADIRALATWNAAAPAEREIPFKPARVVLQDFTGVPCVVDLAAMRAAMQRLGGDPARINPLVPVDLVIDHSVQVDFFGSADALQKNVDVEFERNAERYAFLRWGQQAFRNFRVVPPAIGIVHQVNLEYLAGCVFLRDPDRTEAGGKRTLPVAVPDTLVGTDSHTTMINGIGVVGWGVGGIEAEAGMLGQPVYFLTPDVVGVELSGRLLEGLTATDVVLTITEMLRKAKVVGKFVEFFGEGTERLSVTDRATIANMAPEYGATMGFFPVDDKTIDYFKGTGRTTAEIDAFKSWFKSQGMYGVPKAGDIDYSTVLKLDLGTVVPSLAGPKRPQDRIEIGKVASTFADLYSKPAAQNGFNLTADSLNTVHKNADGVEVQNGDVLIAAITSCTNTSNPGVLLAAGLLAKKAVEAGLKVSKHIKTSLAPGSRVVTEYLENAGLLPYLEKLGFSVAAYGCTTCIGNAGDLTPAMNEAITKNDLICAAVLSGNRNFEARIHPNLKANFLASPPLVVAYAIAGNVRVDLMTEPVGKGKGGKDIYLGDIWPSSDEINALMKHAMNPKMFKGNYAQVKENPGALWEKIKGVSGQVYDWPSSTYIARPPFFDDFGMTPQDSSGTIADARALALFGDSITTDHISPAGSIKESSPAGKWLIEHGVAKADFNSYGSRRGNHEVMMRGTFANVRIKNLMLPAAADGSREEGGVTLMQPGGEKLSIYDAAMRYVAQGTPTVIFGGEEYGTGSSRDWAAKGTQLLGVRAVVARSFERIHRSNLVGMGVLPLQFKGSDSWQSLGINGDETFDIEVPDELKPQQDITLVIRRADGSVRKVKLLSRIDTAIEVDYYKHGGILPYVLRDLLAA